MAPRQKRKAPDTESEHKLPEEKKGREQTTAPKRREQPWDDPNKLTESTYLDCYTQGKYLECSATVMSKRENKKPGDKDYPMSLMSCPALVLDAHLSGLGKKPFNKPHGPESTLEMDVIIGELPDEVRKAHPELAEDQEKFLVSLEELSKDLQRKVYESESIHPGQREAAEKAAYARAKQYSDNPDKESTDNDAFNECMATFQGKIECERGQYGQRVLRLRAKTKTLIKRDPKKDSGIPLPPNFDYLGDEQRAFYEHLGPNGEYKRRDIKFWDEKHQPMFEAEMLEDPFKPLIGRGHLISFGFGETAWSLKPVEGGYGAFGQRIDLKPNKTTVHTKLEGPEVEEILARNSDDGGRAQTYGFSQTTTSSSSGVGETFGDA